MTKHLTPEELVDLVEERLDPIRAGHVDTCERCRDQAAGLGLVVSRTRELTVPEPSPLFWSHQADRIQAAVGSDRRLREGWWRWPRIGRLSAAAISVILVAVVIGLSTNAPRRGRPAGDPGLAPDAPVVFGVERGGGEGAAWALLLTMTEGVDWQAPEVEPWAVDPEAIDGAVSELSSLELRDLVRLLEAELEGSSL